MRHLDENGEVVEYSTKSIPDATWNTVAPRPKPRRLECNKCHVSMLLFPKSLDEKSLFWQCPTCQRKITLQERDQTFLELRQAIKQEYNLKEFNWNKETRQWIIVSTQFEGRDRLDAVRVKIGTREREEIIQTFIQELRHQLQIFFETIEDFFVE